MQSKMRVAGTLTDKDWEELAKTLKPEKTENWGNAFHFFEERIRTRYLEPIQSILDMEKYEGEGFAAVSLQCSLIETIESFINSWIYSNKTKDGFIKNKWHHKKNIVKNAENKDLTNIDIFSSFFSNRSPIKELQICGEDFFRNVRCALLHETQTKSNWRIKKCSSATESYCESPTSKIIYRDQFQKDLKMVIEDYKKAIIEGRKFGKGEISTKELRKNFKTKFNHLCNQ